MREKGDCEFMSLIGKNRAIFSYSNKDKHESKFIYKDFEKTKSYNTSFVDAKFIGTSLRAAKMKFCNFSRCEFQGVDFIGTNLRGSKFINASFQDCIFLTTVLDKTNFKNALFENCYFLGAGIKLAKNFPEKSDGVYVLPSLPAQGRVSAELKQVIEELRENDIIRRSRTLHLKKGRVNTLSLMILEKEYTEKELLKYLPILPKLVSTQFYTVSYLKELLKKAVKYDTI